jgi:small subunit ribosomal protein S7e
VVFVGQRRILRKPGRNSRQKQPRPMSRTLTVVHDKILEDLVFPTEIVGKRTRVLTDGRKIIKVYDLFHWFLLILGSSIQRTLHR